MGYLNFRRRPKVGSRLLLLQQLEERIVLDAAVNQVVDDNQQNQPDGADGPGASDAVGKAGQGSTGADTSLAPPPVPENLTQVFGADLNIILISNSLADVEGISDAVAKDAQVIVYDEGQDNLNTVIGKLEDLTQSTGHQIGTLAIVDHGGAGFFNVGSDEINLHNLWAYRSTFEGLRDDLASDAQIQLYACDTAGNNIGTELVNSIALYTGADVFASVDETGGPHGDWTLEYSSSSDVSYHPIIDSGSLPASQDDLGGNPGEPMNTWFHGEGGFTGWDIYNYDLGVYYTKNYTTYWNHLDADSWQYFNTASWVNTDDLGKAPYGDGVHYGAVGAWFTAPSGVEDYSGHNVYIGNGVTYYQDDLGCSPSQYWAHHDSGGSWQHYDGSVWRDVSGFEAYPQQVWFHYGLDGYDAYDYSGGLYFTTNYTTYWNHLDADSWQYFNTITWVTTDDLGKAPYGDGVHYGAVGVWFTAPPGVGEYSGHNVYIGNGVTYYQDDLGCSPSQYWSHHDSGGSWQHYDGSAWRDVSGFEAYPQAVWFHYGLGGYDAYDYTGGIYYTKDYTTYWNDPDAGSWEYYNTASWVTTNDLGNAPYGDGLHYGAVGSWFTAPSDVGEYSNYDVYIGSGVTYYSQDFDAPGATYWMHNASGWSYYDTSKWYTTAGFNVEPTNVWFHGYGPDAGWDTFNYSDGSYYTQTYANYWQHVTATDEWNYYNGSQWLLTETLGDVPTVVTVDGVDYWVWHIQHSNYTPHDRNELIYGTSGDDTIDASGLTYRYIIYGGDGNDTITGGAGADRLYGEAGNDTLSDSGPGNILDGGTGNDFFYIETGYGNTLNGGDGNDNLFTSADASGHSANVLNGGAGNDTLQVYGNTSNNVLNGGLGDDFLIAYGHSAGNTLNGDAGNDTLQVYEYAVNNVLNGGADDDSLAAMGSATDNTLNGNEGRDSLLAWGDSANNVLNGGADGDYLYAEGNASNNVLNGEDGDDNLFAIHSVSGNTLNGDAGSDYFYVYNNASHNVLSGGDGDDGLNAYGGATGNTLNGDHGYDTLNVYGNANNNVLSGGDGDDSLHASDSATGNTLNGDAGDDTLTSTATATNTLNGGADNDTITGSDSAADVLNGDAGNDTIHGGGGDDTITGGAGVDSLYGDADNDTISDFDSGNYLDGGTGNDTLTLEAGTGHGNTLNGGDGNDTLVTLADATGFAANTLNGDAGSDTLDVHGYAANNVLNGGGEGDTLNAYGNATGNALNGGAGNDTLNGSGSSAGNTYYGGFGADSITGGSGNDVITHSDTLSNGPDGSTDTINGGGGLDTIYSNSWPDLDQVVI